MGAENSPQGSLSPAQPLDPGNTLLPSYLCLYAQLSTPHGPGMITQNSSHGGTSCPEGLVFAQHLALTTEAQPGQLQGCSAQATRTGPFPSKGRERRLSRPAPTDSGDQAGNWLLWTDAQQDEIGGAGAAWEDEAVCTHEAQGPALITRACLASATSSLEAAFPRTLLSPCQEPWGKKPPETSFHPRL